MEFRRVPDEGWLVRVADRPASDPTAVLGFIEQEGPRFAVTLLSQPGARRRVDSLDAARSLFSATLATPVIGLDAAPLPRIA